MHWITVLSFIAIFSQSIVVQCAKVQAPAPPQWPTHFDAAIEVKFNHSKDVFQGQWDFSQTQQKERQDFLFVFSNKKETFIWRYDEKPSYLYCLETDLKTGKSSCTKSKISNMFSPDFSDYTYKGKDWWNGYHADHWSLNGTFEYFDTPKDNVPVGYVSPYSIISFSDFVDREQPSDLFDIPSPFDKKCPEDAKKCKLEPIIGPPRHTLV